MVVGHSNQPVSGRGASTGLSTLRTELVSRVAKRKPGRAVLGDQAASMVTAVGGGRVDRIGDVCEIHRYSGSE